jgi:formylglycine-generating enzyme required for sulfatase activity
VSDAANTKVYIEGTYSFADKKLKNVTYHGCKSTSGTTATGTVNGVMITYIFEDVKTTDDKALSTANIKQWNKEANYWQPNREFTPAGNTETTVKRKSAVIMLVLDCSSSLGSQFTTMQAAANAFIDKMAAGPSSTGGSGDGGTGSGGGSGDGGGGNDGDTGGGTGGQTGSGTYAANGVSFDMVTVPGGTTTLNSTNVTLSDFSIGKHEVTQGLWYAVMGSYPSTSPSSSYGSGSNYPMYYVSWQDIVGTSGSVGYTINGISYYTNGFCYKLSQLVGSGVKFRLPTEAQWEYAAKGGQQTHNYTYSGSNTIDGVAWYSSNSSTIHVVGTKAANELGIYDMSGNVWEWCSDWYGSTYPTNSTNPTGATSGSSRVIRGGSWGSNAEYCRVSYRYVSTPDFRSNDLGFRLALSSE